MTNLHAPVENTTLPVDGKEYHFAKYSVEDTNVDILSPAATALGVSAVHVKIEVVSAGTIGISVNGIPADPANGKTAQLATPWDVRMRFENLLVVRTAGTDPVDIEVEAWGGE
jgi:hypothetical protein